MQVHPMCRLGALALTLTSNSILAENYYWWNIQEPYIRYNAPQEVCQAYKQSLPPTTWIKTVSTVLSSTTEGYCFGIGNGMVSRQVHFARAGSTCPTGDSYNPGNGQCEPPDTPLARKEQGKPTANICTNNSINIAARNTLYIEQDYSAAEQSLLRFERYYNSLSGLWSHNFSTRLAIDTTSIAILFADGRQSIFYRTGNTATSEITELGILTKLSNSWIYISPENETLEFDESGRLIKWKKPGTSDISLLYNASSVTAIDAAGNALTFTEDIEHQPRSVIGSGINVNFDISDGLLTKAIFNRTGSTTQKTYHYEDNAHPRLLTGITDQNGARFVTWSYDSQGRPSSSEHFAGYGRTTIAYNPDSSTTVTNEYERKTIYRTQLNHGVRNVVAIEGQATPGCPASNSSFTYAPQGLLKTRTDAKGNVTTYDYNDRGLETSRTEASGTPQARTITTEWHPTLFLKTKVTEPDRITTYQYDAQGHQTGQIVTPR